MPDRFIVEAAPMAQWPAALDLAFQHLEPGPRSQRVANALAMLTAGEIPPQAILTARHDGALVGAMVCLPLRGGSGLFWPPQATLHANPEVADALVRHGLSWLRLRGAKLAQAFVATADLPLVTPLLRCGFAHVTRLSMLRHDLAGVSPPSPAREGPVLSFETYQAGNQKRFHDTLLATYEGTLDCPELNGRRTIEEIIEGHQNLPRFRPELWWLALAPGGSVGVVMLAEVPDWQGWELSYLGVVPGARGHGFGRAMTQRALEAAYEAAVPQLAAAVDVRNGPACQLYEKMGFVCHDQREVLLFFFASLDDNISSTSSNLHQATS